MRKSARPKKPVEKPDFVDCSFSESEVVPTIPPPVPPKNLENVDKNRGRKALKAIDNNQNLNKGSFAQGKKFRVWFPRNLYDS